MNSMQLTYKHSHKTLWLGLAGTLVVIVGSLLFGYAQVQKKEAEVMNPTKPIPSDAELQRQLTKDQYHVTREGGTETAFHNAYWDNHQPGIYVDELPANRSSVHLINSTAARAGPVSPSRFQRARWRKNGIPLLEWSALRFAQNQAIPISATFFRTAPRRPASATVSTPPRCVLFQWKN